MPTIREFTVADKEGVARFLTESADLYPAIGEWWELKVCPALRAGRRRAVVLDNEGELGGLAILKPGPRVKLCSIRVREPWRDQGWGTRLLAFGLERMAGGGTPEVYVTVSEALPPEHLVFFQRIGFRRIANLRNKYVHGVDEFVYVCPARCVQELLDNVGGISPVAVGEGEFVSPESPVPDLLMSIKPKFAERILSGLKDVEFRRLFSRKHQGASVLFYVTKPVGSLMFTARIGATQCAPKGELWSAYGGAGGVAREEFDEYLRGRSSGYALRLADIERLDPPIDIDDAVGAFPELKPPQSFKRLTPTSALAAFLGARLGA